MQIQVKDRTYYLTADAGIRHYAELRTCREHTHDFLEFVYILRGRCVHTIDGSVYPVKKGDLLIIDYGQKHSIISGAGEYINIFLKPEYLSETIGKQTDALALLDLVEFSEFKKSLAEIKNLVSFSDFELATVENLLLNLEAEMNEKPMGHSLSTRSWFNLLLIMIFRKMSVHLSERFNGVSNELLTYVQSHCREKLEMSEIAEKCHYHPSYFSRLFREFCGMSFREFVKKSRINRAALLLANTGLSVTDVCFESGYSDKTKFFRHFREITGMTPLAYRKSMIP